MKGRVDDGRRALCEILVRRSETADGANLTVWIDTAFNGCLVFPQSLIDQLDLEQAAATEAILADGSQVTLESYLCFVEWFGHTLPVQVIANEGVLPLLGTELLDQHTLTVDYRTNLVTLT